MVRSTETMRINKAYLNDFVFSLVASAFGDVYGVIKYREWCTHVADDIVEAIEKNEEIDGNYLNKLREKWRIKLKIRK